MIDAAGSRIAGQTDGSDAQERTRQVKLVFGEIVRMISCHALTDSQPGDERDRGVHHQQPLPADVGESRTAQQWPQNEATHTDHDHDGHGPHTQIFFLKKPEYERVGNGRHHRSGHTKGGTQGDQLTERIHHDNEQAHQPEQRQSRQQDTAAAEPIGYGAGSE